MCVDGNCTFNYAFLMLIVSGISSESTLTIQ